MFQRQDCFVYVQSVKGTKSRRPAATIPGERGESMLVFFEGYMEVEADTPEVANKILFDSEEPLGQYITTTWIDGTAYYAPEE